MERRVEPRVPTSGLVHVTLLGEQPKTLEATVVNASAHGLRLLMAAKPPVGAAVRVDFGGSMLLGEICYVESVGDKHAAGLLLDQVLRGLPELAILSEAIAGASAAIPAPVQRTAGVPAGPAPTGRDILSGECGNESPSSEAGANSASSSCENSASAATTSAPMTGTR